MDSRDVKNFIRLDLQKFQHFESTKNSSNNYIIKLI